MDLIQCKEEHSLNMFLYSKKKHQQVVQQCALIAFEKGESLVPTDFNEYDMMNYFGTKHLEEFLAKVIKDNPKNYQFLDVGIGFGGPSRYIAHRYGSHINGLELSEDNAKVCLLLNKIVGLNDKINVVVADVAQLDFFGKHNQLKGLHDFVISILALLHIPSKSTLFQNISLSLKSGGHIYFEDYFVEDGHEISEQDKLYLSKNISVPMGFLLHKQEYLNLLTENNFESIEFCDMTDSSSKFVWERYRQFLLKKDFYRELYGEAWSSELENFYKSVALIFREKRDTKADEFFKGVNFNDSFMKLPSHIRCCKVIAKKK